MHTCVANLPVIGFLRWKGCVVIDFSAAETGGITLVSEDKHTCTHTEKSGTYQYTGSIIWEISSVWRRIRLCHRMEGKIESGRQGEEK